MFLNSLFIEAHNSKNFLLQDGFKYFFVILFSFFNTVLLTAILKKYAAKFVFFQRAEDGREEAIKIFRLGGIAIFMGFVVTFLFFKEAQDFINLSGEIPYSLIFLGASLIFLIGLVDDIIYLTPKIRLFFQFSIGILIWFYGLRIGNIDISFLGSSFSDLVLPPVLNLFFTVVFLVGTTNAINWIDGLDGLASGYIAISSIGTFLVLFLNSYNNDFFLPLCLAGSAFGFLLFNFYPAKIYMGDGGSNFFGFMIAIITILITQLSKESISLITLLFLNLLPIANMTFVIFERIYHGLSPFYPDNRHIHYKIMNLGLSHKKSVLLLYVISILCVFLAFIF